jgi:hypothetical protein
LPPFTLSFTPPFHWWFSLFHYYSPLFLWLWYYFIPLLMPFSMMIRSWHIDWYWHCIIISFLCFHYCCIDMTLRH